jgi:hypothetical protein
METDRIHGLPAGETKSVVVTFTTDDSIPPTFLLLKPQLTKQLHAIDHHLSFLTQNDMISFFELAPRSKTLFGLRFNLQPTAENLAKNPVAVSHIIRLLHLLNLVLTMEGPPELLYNVLEDVGRRHLKYKATAQMIPLMGEAVLLSLKKWLGDDVWTEPVQAAWECVFDLIENRMVKGMAK